MTELVVHHEIKPLKPPGPASVTRVLAVPAPAATLQPSVPPPSASQVRKRKRSNSDQITCKCKKSGCLQMYCDCFAAGKKCEGCACSDCKNDGLHHDDVLAAIKRIKANNPHAFEQKIIPEGQAVIHSKGCNCRNSHCLKRYCECYAAGVQCSSKCKCVSCQNGKPPGDDQDGEGEKSCSPPASEAAQSPAARKILKAEYNMSPRGRLQLHFNNQVHFGGPMSSPPLTPHNGHHPVSKIYGISVFAFLFVCHASFQNNVTPYHNMVASPPPNSPSLAELRQCVLPDVHVHENLTPVSQVPFAHANVADVSVIMRPLFAPCVAASLHLLLSLDFMYLINCKFKHALAIEEQQSLAQKKSNFRHRLRCAMAKFYLHYLNIYLLALRQKSHAELYEVGVSKGELASLVSLIQSSKHIG